ncbi:unnamed protein product, partial [Musa hybrid cultivar]
MATTELAQAQLKSLREQVFLPTLGSYQTERNSIISQHFLLSSVNGKHLQYSLTYKLSQASRNGGIRNARFFLLERDGSVAWRRILRAHLDRARSRRAAEKNPHGLDWLFGWMEGPVPAAGSKIPDGKAQSLFYVFLLCFRGMEAGDDALHLFLGPAPSIKYHISDILDHCHPSIRFPTMVRGSYQSTVRGGFGSGKWKHEIRFARLL